MFKTIITYIASFLIKMICNMEFKEKQAARKVLSILYPEMTEYQQIFFIFERRRLGAQVFYISM